MNVGTKRTDSGPLYLQVRAELLSRIETGVWKPGEWLPSEFALADEMGVSQGTVRKALDRLERDQLVVRRQGRGTFVAEQTPTGVLFRFFKIYGQSGNQVLPESRNVRVKQGGATRAERDVLCLQSHAKVLRIRRTRLNGDVPFIRDTIVLPLRYFPSLGNDGCVPNTLYDLFQRNYGVTVARADEEIEAVGAARRDTRYLNVDEGQPLLKVSRIAFDLNGRPIEWRVSLCHLKGLHYRAELR